MACRVFSFLIISTLRIICGGIHIVGVAVSLDRIDLERFVVRGVYFSVVNTFIIVRKSKVCSRRGLGSS